jgi:hypothetical protein
MRTEAEIRSQLEIERQRLNEGIAAMGALQVGTDAWADAAATVNIAAKVVATLEWVLGELDLPVDQ